MKTIMRASLAYDILESEETQNCVNLNLLNKKSQAFHVQKCRCRQTHNLHTKTKKHLSNSTILVRQ